MTHHAQIDVEWGGENVYVRTNTDAIQVQAFLTDTDADTMRTQLGWAVGEVRRFRQHLANGGRADLFDGQPKPADAQSDPDGRNAEIARLTAELAGMSDMACKARDFNAEQIETLQRAIMGAAGYLAGAQWPGNTKAIGDMQAAVDRLTRERDEARREVDQYRKIRDLCVDSLARIGRSFGITRDACEESPSTQASKIVGALASRPAIPAFLAGLVTSLRAAGWSEREITHYCEERLGSGLTIPDDAETLAWSACIDDDRFTALDSSQIMEVIRKMLKAVAPMAPVSGSDTATSTETGDVE